MEAKALRLVGDDEQAVFGFAHGEAGKALAIPEWDLDLWRGRSDVRHRPGFFAVRYELIADPRWLALREAADRIGIPLEYVAGVLFMTAGCALRCEWPGILYGGGRPLAAKDVARFWGCEDSSGFARAMGCCIAAGWIAAGDIETMKVNHAYVPVRARTGTYGRVRARSGACVDGRTDRQTDIAVVDDPRARPRAESATGDLRDDDDGSASGSSERTTTTGPRGGSVGGRKDARLPERSADGREPLRVTGSRNGFWRDIPLNHHLEAMTRIGFRLIDFREAEGLRLYPADQRDQGDLSIAVRRATKAGTLPDLLRLLERCAHQCDSGAGFRTAMRRAGFLPEIEATTD